MSETPSQYGHFSIPKEWQCSETDQHFRIDGPGVSFVCKFPEQLVKAGNTETRYWHMGSFDVVHTVPNLWEIIQGASQSSLTIVIPHQVGTWLVQKLEKAYSKR